MASIEIHRFASYVAPAKIQVERIIRQEAEGSGRKLDLSKMF